MFVFDNQLIQNLAASLARHWLQSDASARANAPGEEALTQTLASGVAAFLCVITGTLQGREEWLRPIVERYFGGSETARACGRLFEGQEEARQDLAELFLDAGMAGDALDRGAFDEALAVFVAAVAETAQRNDLLTYMRREQPDGATLVPYWLRDPIAGYIDSLAAGGLGGVVDGRVIAADGQTVIFGAQIGWGMAEAMGPNEGAKDIPELAAVDMVEVTVGGDTVIIGNIGSGMVGSGSGAVVIEPGAGTKDIPEPTAVDLRLDAALPANVFVGRAFDLVVAIRQPESKPLAPEDLERRESADFGVLWPADAPSIQLRIQISAPDCEILGGDSRAVRLLAGKNSPDVIFQLTPQRAGPLSVIITVYQETDWIGSARLRTQVGVESERGGLSITVDSRPLGNEEVNLVTLRQALDDGYSDSELRDLCFELEIDYEDLAGDSQSAKARELILFAKRRNLLARLVACVMRDRPHLLVPA